MALYPVIWRILGFQIASHLGPENTSISGDYCQSLPQSHYETCGWELMGIMILSLILIISIDFSGSGSSWWYRDRITPKRRQGQYLVF